MSKRGRQDDRESVAHAIEVLCCRAPSKGETEGLSLTPLEQQVVALKESIAPHVILMVACGYRVKFYGSDSRTVSRRVGILCIPGQPFEYSSVPYARVDLYVHRLVAMGYQVGFADQESAAMRAADGLKSGLFTRTVSQLYSRGTLLPTEHVVTNGGSGGGSAAIAEASPKKMPEEGENEESEGVEGTGCAEQHPTQTLTSFSPSFSRAVDASERFLCFLNAQHVGEGAAANLDDDEATALSRSPLLEMILVTFVTQRRCCYTVRTALEMEDIMQRLDIAEVVVLTAQTPPSLDVQGGGEARLDRTTACFLQALPEVYRVALHHSLPLHLGPTANGEEDDKTVTVSGYVCRCSQDVDSAIEAYLKPFKLDQVYHFLCQRAGADFTEDSIEASLDAPPTSTRQRLTSAMDTNAVHLPGPTLRALGVFHSGIGLHGSLLGLLDRSLTACGARCLRRWLAAPLSSRTAIEARQAATVFLMNGYDDGRVEELLRECARLGDIEAVVGKLHAERCHVVEFVRLLRMVRCVAALAHELCSDGPDDGHGDKGADVMGDSTTPPLIRSLLSAVCSPAVTQLLDVNTTLLQTTATTPLEFFSESGRAVPAELQIHWNAKKAAEAALEAELKAAREVLHLPGLEYRTIGGTAYLLDVPQSKCSRVPADWLVQTRTKTNVRYHTPTIAEQQVARTAAIERLALAAAAAWRRHQREIVSNTRVMDALTGVVAAIGALDALHSLAVASRQPGYVMPHMADLPEVVVSNAPTTSTVALSIREGRHPILDQLLPHGYVSCCVELHVGGAWLLTGPNMGGKSALMRMVGTFVVLAQIGCGVPADAAVLPVFHGVYCRMGASDSILEGSSTFLSEMDETSRILRAADLHRSLVLMDELGRGTSSFDGAAVAAATLEYLVAHRATTMFVTHYSYLCDPYVAAENDAARSAVRCYFMGFTETEGVPGDACSKQLVFTYKPCRGVTPSSFGVTIGRKAGLPAAVTLAASEVSAKVEQEHRFKQDLHQLRRRVQSRGEE